MSDEERETKPFKFVTGMTPPSVAIELERKLTLVDPIAGMLSLFISTSRPAILSEPSFNLMWSS